MNTKKPYRPGIDGPYVPSVIYDPKRGYLIDSKTGERVDPKPGPVDRDGWVKTAKEQKRRADAYPKLVEALRRAIHSDIPVSHVDALKRYRALLAELGEAE